MFADVARKAPKEVTCLVVIVVLAFLVACEMNRRSQPRFRLNTGATSENLNYELLYLNSLIENHQRAIRMANRAIKESSISDIKVMAVEMKDTEQHEVYQLLAWRKAWYPNLNVSAEVEMPVENIADDSSIPFDLRFLEAMIPHNQTAIKAAEEASGWAEHAELRAFLDRVIRSQQADITSMQQWKMQWFGKQSDLLCQLSQ